MFGSEVESRTQCGKCKKETVRSSKSLLFELAYPDLGTKFFCYPVRKTQKKIFFSNSGNFTFGQGNTKFLLKVGGKSVNFIFRLTQAFRLISVLNVTSHFTPKQSFINFYCSNYHRQGREIYMLIR